MQDMPERGFYYHFKHDPAGPINNCAYEVLGTARSTEDDSLSVVYLPLYESEWPKPANYALRPLNIFMETLERNGQTMPRFRKIEDPAIIAQLIKIRDTMHT
jgi:hypothetical protein